jgi:hypothetical protein
MNANFLRSGLSFQPIGLALTNTGPVTVTDIRVILEPSPESSLRIRNEEKLSCRPLHASTFNGLGSFGSFISFPQEDITVEEQAKHQKVLWIVPKALPHLPVFSEGMFYVTAPQSSLFELQCTIFAENLPSPSRATLAISLQKETRDLTPEEIASISATFTSDDMKSGRGRTL